MSDSLWPHGLQHDKPPCPSLSPRVCPSSGPLNRWCYSTISSSAVLFSFCLQSSPASGSFPISWLFTSGGRSTGALPSASIFPMSIQGWLPFGLTGSISLLSKEISAETTLNWRKGGLITTGWKLPGVPLWHHSNEEGEETHWIHRKGICSC